MGTQCYIAEEKENGKYLSIYCQLDGYPEVVGELLVNRYNSPENLNALLSLGDVYSLREKLEPDPSMPHDVENGYQRDVTIAFGRDCDRSGFEAKERTLDEMIDSDECIEFIYVFNLEQEWEFSPLLDYDASFRKVNNYLNSNEETKDAEESDQILGM